MSLKNVLPDVIFINGTGFQKQQAEWQFCPASPTVEVCSLRHLASVAILACLTVPPVVSSTVAQAQELRTTADKERAIAELGRIIRLDPRNADVYANRGAGYLQLGKYDLAIADFDQAIKLRPTFKHVLNDRGYTRLIKGDLVGALNDFNRAIELDSNYVAPYISRSAIRLKMGEPDMAIADLDQAIKRDPNNAKAYDNRGCARLEKGDLDGAIRDHDQAIKIDPHYASAYHNRGYTRFKMGDLDAAVNDYDQALKLNPNLVEAYRAEGAHLQKRATLMVLSATSIRQSNSVTTIQLCITIAVTPCSAKAMLTQQWKITRKRSNTIPRTRRPISIAGTPT
jgi:tetratricopeptide (TPR) repeat protein